MKFTQYDSYVYLYILIVTLIPAVILGCMGKKIKYYGLFISFFMSVLIIGIEAKSLLLFSTFIIGEVILIMLYCKIRANNDSKIIYRVVLLLSMCPVIILKISSIMPIGPIGFVGLSYLNFKVMQVIIEIYDGIIKEVRFIDVLYFLIFFPTLSTGPIDRSRRFDADSNLKVEGKVYVEEYLAPAITKIIMGIGYKFVIAYLIHTYWMDNIASDITFLNALSYMYAYSLYLFFDFSGYSYFAVGTSYILGVKTPDNFNMPFISKDMKEFWTRWHISLSKWFGDFLYSRILLESVRKKRFKNRFRASHFAQMITMLVMGLWHGFTVFYIIYGLYQGAALVLTDIYQRKSKFYKKHKKEKWFQYIQIVINFNVACFGLLLFSGYLFK